MLKAISLSLYLITRLSYPLNSPLKTLSLICGNSNIGFSTSRYIALLGDIVLDEMPVKVLDTACLLVVFDEDVDEPEANTFTLL